MHSAAELSRPIIRGARTLPRAAGAPQVAGNSVEVTGFHAKRCEFDPEYDQEAECIVADLEFQEDEPQDELQARRQSN